MEEVKTVITQESAKIECNFAQVEQAIRSVLAEYKDAVFTEDSKVYAKKHVASLRAQKKSFQDNLREEKKKYMKPWDDFEQQAKRLINMYDEPIDLINGQVQAFEEKRIAEKKKLIEQIYHETIAEELTQYIPLQRIYNAKWENATCREKEIRREMSDVAAKAAKDIQTIIGMDSDAVDKALSIYQSRLDVSEAISYINNYERQKQEILAKEQERKRQEEEERIRREERERILAEQRAQETARQAEIEKQAAIDQAREEAAQEVFESLIPESDGQCALYEYRVSLSADAKQKLEMYMDSVGIEWELIEEG